MAVNKYSRVIQPAQMRQMSYEDIARVPTAYQKYELTALDTLGGMDLGVQVNPGDKPALRALTAPLEAEIEDLTTSISRGITQSDINRVIELQSKYRKLTSPSGGIGQLKASYDNAQAFKEELAKLNKDWDPELRSQYYSKMLQEHTTFKPEDTEFKEGTVFTGNYLPKYVDVTARTNDYLKGLTADQVITDGEGQDFSELSAYDVVNNPRYQKYIDSDVLTELIMNRMISDPELIRYQTTADQLMGIDEPIVKETLVEKDGEQQVIRDYNPRNTLYQIARSTADIRGFSQTRTAQTGKPKGPGALKPGVAVASDVDLQIENYKRTPYQAELDNVDNATQLYATAGDALSKQTDESNNVHGIHSSILGEQYENFNNPEFLTSNLGKQDITLSNGMAIKPMDYYSQYEKSAKELITGLQAPDANPGEVIKQFVTSMSPLLGTGQDKILQDNLIESYNSNPDALLNTLSNEVASIGDYQGIETSYLQTINEFNTFNNELDKAYQNLEGKSIKETLITGREKRVNTSVINPFAQNIVAQSGESNAQATNEDIVANYFSKNRDVFFEKGPEAFKESVIKDINNSNINAAEKDSRLREVDGIYRSILKNYKEAVSKAYPEYMAELVSNNVGYDLNEATVSVEKNPYLATAIDAIRSVAPETTRVFMKDEDGNTMTIQSVLSKPDSWEQGAQKGWSEIKKEDIDIAFMEYNNKKRAVLTIPGLKTPLILDDETNSILQDNLNTLFSPDISSNRTLFFSIDETTTGGKQLLSSLYRESNPMADMAYQRLVLNEHNKEEGSSTFTVGDLNVKITYDPDVNRNKVVVEYANDKETEERYFTNIASAYADMGIEYKKAVVENSRFR